jgi:CRP-like cAMP-binding protein
MFNNKNHEKDILFKRIKESNIFESLSDSEINAMLRIAHIREYSTGEKVFTEGTLGLCFYIIVKGAVSLVYQESGESFVIKEYAEGDFFSEVHLFTETNHNVSCVAKEVTKLIIFSKPDLQDLININPKLGNKILLRFLDFLGQKLEVMYKENIELKQQIKLSST